MLICVLRSLLVLGMRSPYNTAARVFAICGKRECSTWHAKSVVCRRTLICLPDATLRLYTCLHLIFAIEAMYDSIVWSHIVDSHLLQGRSIIAKYPAMIGII